MNLVSRLNVIKLLVVKNWKIRLHYKKSFALLFLMPILLVALVVVWTLAESPRFWYYNKYKNVSDTGHRIVYNSTPLFGKLRINQDKGQTIPLFYAPDNSYTKRLMQRVAQVLTNKFGFTYKFDAKGYYNEELMSEKIHALRQYQ